MLNFYPSVIKIFNSCIDFLTGFPFEKSLKAVLAMDTMSREEIDKYQLQMFQKLKEYAVQAEIYKDYRDKPYHDFPIFSRPFRKENHRKFITNIRKPYRVIETSGSTGTPREIIVSKEMILAKRTSHLKMLSWFGLQREDCELYIGWAVENLRNKIYYKLKNKVFLSSYGIDKEKALKYIGILNNKKPRLIFSYPSALNFLLGYAEEFSIQLHQPLVIYTGAENLYPHIEERIRKHFPKSTLVNEYWSTEANIAVTCPNGCMHVDEDTVIIEVINTDENGVGDVLITNLYSYDWPLIRYPVGDRIKLSDQYCTCGRKTKVIEKLYGRDNDFFPLPDGKRFVYLEHDDKIFVMCTGILAFQVLYNAENHRGIFKYIKKADSASIESEKILAYFKRNLTADFRLQQVDLIEPEPSGKHKIFKQVIDL